MVSDGHLGALFFESPAELRAWLGIHHATAGEAWIGYWKKSSGRTGISYEQALDEALCFGWIDGLTRRIDDDRYAIRFTPRRAASNWSARNVRRMVELIAAGRVQPAGLRAFESRAADRPPEYSYENRPAELPAELADLFRADRQAWEFFSRQPPSYRRAMTWFVVSAQRPQTRLRRLAAVIEESAAGRRIDVMNTPKLGSPATRAG